MQRNDRAPRAWIRQRFVLPLSRLLKQGLRPRQLALCVALGMTLSIFPVYGVTVLLCFAVAPLLRLNLPAMQLANLAGTPLQLLFLLPQIHLGERIFGVERSILSAAEIAGLLQGDLTAAAARLWLTLLHGIAAWALLAPVVVTLLYAVTLPLVRRLSRAALRPGAG